GDEAVTLGVRQPFVTHRSVDSLVFLIPNLPVGPASLVVSNQGVDQITQTGSITIASGYTASTAVTAPVIATFPDTRYTSLESLSPTDYFKLDNTSGVAALAVTATVTWQDSENIDMNFLDCATALVSQSFVRTINVQSEIGVASVPIGACWLLELKQVAGTNATMAQLTVTSP
ncbi:MAG: hypothetical protein ACE5FJ_11140, partial [Gemmatimonadales bacterium]